MLQNGKKIAKTSSEEVWRRRKSKICIPLGQLRILAARNFSRKDPIWFEWVSWVVASLPRRTACWARAPTRVNYRHKHNRSHQNIWLCTPQYIVSSLHSRVGVGEGIKTGLNPIQQASEPFSIICVNSLSLRYFTLYVLYVPYFSKAVFLMFKASPY